MRKRAFALALLLFVAAVLPSGIGIGGALLFNSAIPNGSTALVVDIVDVNAIIVRTPDNVEHRVRLIGIHPSGTAEAIAFLSREIMGSQVTLFEDPLIPPSGRWLYMYVVLDDRFVNLDIILSGYGRLNDAHAAAEQFPAMQGVQTAATVTGVGMWASEFRQPLIHYFNVRVNINTATSAQLAAHLDITNAQANNIVWHRNLAPFSRVEDIVFVPDMPRDVAIDNRHRISVVTNINSASLTEIESLAGVASAQAQLIEFSRDGQAFYDAEQLFVRNLMSRWQLNANLPFLSVVNQDTIDFARPNFHANINTATHAQLVRAGASFAHAQTIIQQRDLLPLRSLSDLRDFAQLFSPQQVNALADNLRTHTNINTATLSEIESLLGGNVTAAAVESIMANRPYDHINEIVPFITDTVFARIAPFIYTTTRPEAHVVNINTASMAQMVAAGIPAATAQLIVPAWATQPWAQNPTRPVILRPNQLPAWISAEARQNLSLVTNINTATPMELFSLDSGMTQNLVYEIIRAREEMPFGSPAHVAEFFEEFEQETMFGRFSRFIVVR